MVSFTVLEAHHLFPSLLHSKPQPPPFSRCFCHFLPTFSPPKHSLHPKFSKFLVHRARLCSVHACLPQTHDGIERKDVHRKEKRRTCSKVSSSRSLNERKGENFAQTHYRTKGKDKQNAETKTGKDNGRARNLAPAEFKVSVEERSCLCSKDEEFSVQESRNDVMAEVNEEIEKTPETRGERGKSKKVEEWETKFRAELDMCSKIGDVMGAIKLYDKAQREGIRLKQYHYTVILYLCASAASGVVCRAKSGRGVRVLNFTGDSGSVSMGKKKEKHDNFVNNGDFDETRFVSGAESVNLDGGFAEKEEDLFTRCQEENEFVVSEEIKTYARQRGLEIYGKLNSDNIPMNEASLTSVARMAAATGDGDMAFEMVKRMKSTGINPRLRSYAPALSVFCNGGDVEKALMVEKDMLCNGVYPEEPELEAFLRVCIEAGRSDKVYYLLHKLRTTVRSVSQSTAGTIRKWFESRMASRVGKRKWDPRKVEEAAKNGGGGWHGHGWLGTGKWAVSDTIIGDDGFCKRCGEKLSIIDLDPTETENFAQSVASLARKRDKNSNFQRFQKWLDYYGPFQAVIDAANVGLYSQKRFVPSKVNAVVNGIRQMLPSRKWPLVVLHNRRVVETKKEKPSNKAMFEKWQNADALYSTPSGSNDDWYWLYAAIKFRCLIVTNDEMRDHTFQLLGNDFFPKWKERHQVHFSFSEAGPVFHMPPPYSVMIQESVRGHWHIPINPVDDLDEDVKWLCIVRRNSLVSSGQPSPLGQEDLQDDNRKIGSIEPAEVKIEKRELETLELYQSLRSIVSGSETSSDNHSSVLPELEAAEKLAACVLHFDI
ncbi:PREDICTED: uncharacterized protein LOC104804596 [Tarenaya hassleriana]|uniref:uncharacterized protein LOC104804596 n=1 Tax=Tarenaya hassleriana TaxID=28532 RepID=UPI00053C667E|nr:PREDICTED: uncharacterized protein LOC104804596 [Tarenaya hassleriana]